MDQHQTMIAWLQNAYAMEHDLIKTLEAHLDQAEDFPEVERKIRQHLAETETHAEKVKNCLEELGEDTSALKTGLGHMMGMMKGASTGVFHDTVVKNAIAESAAEAFEIATYTAIMTAAETMGHDNVVEICKEILAEEEAMAEWLEENMPSAVEEYLDTLPPMDDEEMENKDDL